jgi:hypothetical protein
MVDWTRLYTCRHAKPRTRAASVVAMRVVMVPPGSALGGCRLRCQCLVLTTSTSRWPTNTAHHGLRRGLTSRRAGCSGRSGDLHAIRVACARVRQRASVGVDVYTPCAGACLSAGRVEVPTRGRLDAGARTVRRSRRCVAWDVGTGPALDLDNSPMRSWSSWTPRLFGRLWMILRRSYGRRLMRSVRCGCVRSVSCARVAPPISRSRQRPV